MNRIYWDRDKISILTDQIEAIEHKHYAIQKAFFALLNEKNITKAAMIANFD